MCQIYCQSLHIDELLLTDPFFVLLLFFFFFFFLHTHNNNRIHPRAAGRMEERGNGSGGESSRRNGRSGERRGATRGAGRRRGRSGSGRNRDELLSDEEVRGRCILLHVFFFPFSLFFFSIFFHFFLTLL